MILNHTTWSLWCDKCGARRLEGTYADYSEAQRALFERARLNNWQLKADGYTRDLCSVCQKKMQ